MRWLAPSKIPEPVAENPWRANAWKDVTNVGFIGDSNRFVVIHKVGESEWRSEAQFGVYNTETGKLLAKMPGPRTTDLPWQDYFSPRFASLFAKDVVKGMGAGHRPTVDAASTSINWFVGMTLILNASKIEGMQWPARQARSKSTKGFTNHPPPFALQWRIPFSYERPIEQRLPQSQSAQRFPVRGPEQKSS